MTVRKKENIQKHGNYYRAMTALHTIVNVFTWPSLNHKLLLFLLFCAFVIVYSVPWLSSSSSVYYA